MLRRNARLRREYLYRKSLEGKERDEYERKRRIREALAEGKPIPTDLRADERALRHAASLEDDNTAVPRTHADDEYARAGAREPSVLVTTARDPSTRLAAFAKEVRLILPNAVRVNRGAQTLADLVASARAHDFTDVVLLHEHRGEPAALAVCHLPHGPTALFGVHGAVLRHDLGDKRAVGTLSEAAPHLIFDGFTTPLGTRFKTVLTHLFPPPKPDAKRVITFANRGSDYVSVRHHTVAAPRGPASAALTEVGPRFELRPYALKLGTLDNDAAEYEWTLRAYVRSARKAKLGGGGGAGGDAADGGDDEFRMAARGEAPRKRSKKQGA